MANLTLLPSEGVATLEVRPVEPRSELECAMPKPERLPAREGLTFGDWRVFFHAYLLLPAIWVVVRTVSFKRLRCWAERERRRRSQAEPTRIEFARRCASLVAAAARRHPAPMKCLVRSLTLARILSGFGIQSWVVIGVTPGARRPLSHAWVEVDGEPVNETSDIRLSHFKMEPVAH